MHKHVLEVELQAPIVLRGKPTTTIILLKVNCNELESEQLTQNVLNAIETCSGEYSVYVSDDSGNPYNPHAITLNLDNIRAVWK